ncbi:protein CLEC16A homolog isoform X3 [Leptopilina boulardi]|uniref:protein CLEC16A homolog isoform X3 n=1 Tax=Leptopilina boulardi TaxID=63433 RepID=UPI0021F56E3A|nr:protein CLEC16A homolog isoform X3 [Leptopilina boulardi]
MFRSRSWFGGGFWKPKNRHSLEHLKYLYNILSKNQIVSDNNRGLLVETLRSIAEILIWGDQNDSSVFDFFLEKNMLSFFLRIMKQKCGSYVCVQLLQTLNILFENIRNETSLYYLLSNNHVNSIIVHKFDFSDEEVMAYYISFLKTLSLKLNAHTIHFFYNEVNEHTNDFPLYTEAIKFFNHSEGMVRIAVRTLTLNVYRVEDASMLAFIRDKTAAPYFSNLVWFIGNHIIELDTCVRNDADHQSQNRLSDLVAEHLDHLHYLNDILCLNIKDLNKVLTEHLLRKLLIPLYIYSLVKHKNVYNSKMEKKHVSIVVSLFLLSQVFLIVSHGPLVKTLSVIILMSSLDAVQNGSNKILEDYIDLVLSKCIAFTPPKESLEKSLENLAECLNDPNKIDENNSKSGTKNDYDADKTLESNMPSTSYYDSINKGDTFSSLNELEAIITQETIEEIKHLNVTDEEKEQRLALETPLIPNQTLQNQFQTNLANKPFLETILNSLCCTENDYAALFALCLLFALANNQGIQSEILSILLSPTKESSKNWYNEILIDRLIQIITLSCQTNVKVRLITLELAIKILIQMVISEGRSLINDSHLAAIETAKEQSAVQLRNFYKSEDIFLDMFEDEYSEVQKRPLKVEWLMMDSNILLPPTGTPMTGIEFSKRLPCGEVERARRSIRVFFLIRELALTINTEMETQLPLTNPISCVQVNNVLDLNNSDLIACTVVWKDGQKIRRFLVIDVLQLILVEPDTKKLGWGVAKFVGFLQDIEVVGDKDDSRCLHLTIHKPLSNSSSNKLPVLCAKFIFDDHIRCMAAKQRLTKGRIKARQKKMGQIARLLNIPASTPNCFTPSNYSLIGLRSERRGQRHKDQSRPLFTINKVPGFATQMHRDALSHATGLSSSSTKISPGNSNDKIADNGLNLREHSPKIVRPRSEEIPLEDMSIRKASVTPNCSLCIERKDSFILGSVCNSEGTSVSQKESEETSFTSSQNDEHKVRRRGQVETV